MKEEKEETPTTIPVSELVSNKKVSISLGLTLIVLASTMIVGISIWESKPTVSTSYYHFNIQYRAGDEVSYEEIIENTFQHMVWMYGNHSNWHYTIECQFMLIEYLYEHDEGKYRHIFDAVQKQNEEGQLELIIPQYSNAFQVPYGIKEFKESMNYTKTRMEEYNLTQSKLILLQEGQWLPGFAHAAKQFGFEAAIVSKEQCGYFGFFPDQPVQEYTFKGVESRAYVIPWIGTIEADTYHHQIYTQDGEKINTGGFNVGVAEEFGFNPDKQQNILDRHIELEEMGNTFLRMDEFYDHCVENNYMEEWPEDKYVAECEWVCAQYQQYFTWMGKGSGSPDDGYMLARGQYVHKLIQATEMLLDKAYKDGSITQTQYRSWGPHRYEGTDGKLLEAKKKHWKMQVTDVTGISPAYHEMWYGLNNSKDAIDLCNEIIDDLKPLMFSSANTVQVNPWNRTFYTDNNNPDDIMTITPSYEFDLSAIEQDYQGLNIKVDQREEYNDTYGYITQFDNITLSGNGWGRNEGEILTRLQFGDFMGRYNITFNHTETQYFSEAERNPYATPNVEDKNEVSIIFEDNWSQVAYSPALLENDTISLIRDDFYTHPYNAESEWVFLLSMCNGLAYNHKKGYALIKNTTVRNLAGKWNNDQLEFKETSLKYNSNHEYFLYKGTLAQSLEIANQINTYGTMDFDFS